jgi:hypothetical protein
MLNIQQKRRNIEVKLSFRQWFNRKSATIVMLKVVKEFFIHEVQNRLKKKRDIKDGSLNGNRTRISTLRGSRPKPLDDKAI